MIFKYLVSICFIIPLLGCAPYGAIPKGYQGQVVTIWDNINKVSSSNAHFFELISVDGRKIATSSFDTRDRSFKIGFAMDTTPLSRDIPVNSQVLYIGGFNYLVADIFGLSDFIYRVKGSTKVILKKGITYMVNGKVDDEYAIVWIEEENTGIIVSDIVIEGNVSSGYLSKLIADKIFAYEQSEIKITREKEKEKKLLNRAMEYFLATGCQTKHVLKTSINDLYLMAEALFKNKNYQKSLRCFQRIKRSPDAPRDTYRYLSLFFDVGLGVQEDAEIAKYWQEKYESTVNN